MLSFRLTMFVCLGALFRDGEGEMVSDDAW